MAYRLRQDKVCRSVIWSVLDQGIQLEAITGFWAQKTFVKQGWEHFSCILFTLCLCLQNICTSRESTEVPLMSQVLHSWLRKRSPLQLSAQPSQHFQTFCTLHFLSPNLSSLVTVFSGLGITAIKPKWYRTSHAKFYRFVFRSTVRKVTIYFFLTAALCILLRRKACVSAFQSGKQEICAQAEKFSSPNCSYYWKRETLSR